MTNIESGVVIDSRYTIVERIGSGTTGQVYKATASGTQKSYAIKHFNTGPVTSFEEILQRREIDVLVRILTHNNIIRLYEVIKSKQQLYLVFECADGSLYDVIAGSLARIQENPYRFEEYLLQPDFIALLAYQCFQGLAYLHAHGFIHRDIKPENLLILNDTIKIADFGLARSVTEKLDDNIFTGYVSTRWYRAPEILIPDVPGRYGTGIDIWAIGCVIAEMINLVPLFAGSGESDQLDKIFQIVGSPTADTWPQFSEALLPLQDERGTIYPPIINSSAYERADMSALLPLANFRAVDLLEKIFVINDHFRITANECLQSSWFDLN